MHKVSYFTPGHLSRPSRLVQLSEAYTLFKTGFQEETDYIQKTFAEEILNDFPAGKTAYQDAKKRLQAAVCFAGNIDRSTGAENKDFQHTGLLSLDIDEDEREKLLQVWSVVRSGKLIYIEAAGRSVSGFLTGALWVNVRIEIPASADRLSRKLKQLTGVTGKETHFQLCEKLQESYWKAVQYMFEKDLQISIGTAGKDLKRVRYIANDADLYLNDQADRLKLDTLEFILEKREANEAKKKAELNSFERCALDINEADAFKFAEAFAQMTGSYTEGNRTNYANRIAIALNLLGLPEEAATAYIQQTYGFFDVYPGKDTVRYPYKKYRDSFGLWSNRLKPADVKSEFTFDLAPGQKLSVHADQIADLIQMLGKVDLKSGTGTGKNFAVIKHIAPRLKLKTGKKTVIVTSLNSKAEKDAAQYGIPFLTGEHLKKSGLAAAQVRKEALRSDIIITNQNFFKKLAAYFFDRQESVHVFIDESHTLITGSAEGYKPKVIRDLWNAVNKVACTVTLLSGTPKLYFVTEGFKRIEVRQQERPAIHVTVKTRSSDIIGTALQHIQQTDFNRKKLVIKIQSKEKIRRLKSALLNKGFQASEVVILYSASDVKLSAEYRQFVQATADQQSFADQVKVVLVTSFVNEGLDFYSADQLEFVNIEAKGSFDADEVVQFADRWRTDQEKHLVSYHFRPAEDRDRFYNALQEFQDTLQAWRDQAEGLTEKYALKPEYYRSSALLSLKTAFSNTDRFLFWNDDQQRFEVNFLAVASFIDQEAIKHTTTAAGWKQIAARFAYFKVTLSEDQVCELTEAQKQELDLLKVDDKLKTGQAQSTFAQLYQDDQEALFQAIGMLTSDVQLKKDVQFHESRKDAVKALIDAHSDLFSTYLHEGERMLKTFFGWKKTLLPEDAFAGLFFEVDDTGNLRFKSRQKLTVFMQGIRLHLAFFFFQLAASSWRKQHECLPVLTALQVADVRALRAFCDNVIDCAKNSSRPLTGPEIHRCLKKAFTLHKLTRPDLTQNKAVMLLNIFFRTEAVKSKEGLQYWVQERTDISAFLRENGFTDDQRFTVITNVHNLLEDNSLGVKTIDLIKYLE